MSALVSANFLHTEYTQIKSELCALECKAGCSKIVVCAGCALFCIGSLFSGICTGQTQPFSDTDRFYCRNMCWGNCCKTTDYYLSETESESYLTKSAQFQKISREMEIRRQLKRQVFPDIGGETLDGLVQIISDYRGEPQPPSAQRMV